MSRIGTLFAVTTFGESHGKGVGCIIEGVPPLFRVQVSDIQHQLDRRKPNQNSLLSPRSEDDIVEIYSGIQEGVSLGTPICLMVRNFDVKKSDYKDFIDIPRPGHADFTYLTKYGIKSSSGGGRSSARETISRVAAGSIAEQVLNFYFHTRLVSWVSSIGEIEIPKEINKDLRNSDITKEDVDKKGTFKVFVLNEGSYKEKKDFILLNENEDSVYFLKDLNSEFELVNDRAKMIEQSKETNKEANIVKEVDVGKEMRRIHFDDKEFRFLESINIRCPHVPTALQMIKLIMQVKENCDSVGGIISSVIKNCPQSLGEPCFNKFEAELAKAMLSIPATKGFEIGSGFEGTKLRGSEHNDTFTSKSDKIVAKSLSLEKLSLSCTTNNSGGTLGGITTGEDVYFNVAIKPVSTISKPQETCNLSGEVKVLEAKGRHDPCVLPRAIPIVESMAAIVTLDFCLIQASRKGLIEVEKKDADCCLNEEDIF